MAGATVVSASALPPPRFTTPIFFPSRVSRRGLIPVYGIGAIKAGASGYLLKDTPRAELVKAIRGTIAAKTYLDPSIASRILDQFPNQQEQPTILINSQMTNREKEILSLLALGLNNEDIAKRLFLSVGTVRNHISTILHKLGVSDRTQAAILAIKAGLSEH